MKKIFPIAIFLTLALSVFFLSRTNEPVPIFEQAQIACASAKSRSAYASCLRNILEKSQPQQDMGSLMGDLGDWLNAKGPFTAGNYYLCHDAAHVIGAVGQTQAGSLEAMSACTALCSSGCYHGFMESFIASGGNVEDLVGAACSGSAGQTKFDKACYHGVGHGIGSIVGDIDKAIALCDLIHNEYGKARCFSGALMELYGEGGLSSSQNTYPQDTISFCQSFSGLFERHCFLLSGEKNLLATGSVESAIETCKRASSDRFSECISILGEAIFFLYKNDSDALVGACRKAGVHLEDCLSGVFLGIAESDPSARQGKEICMRIKEGETNTSCQALLQAQVAYETSSN